MYGQCVTVADPSCPLFPLLQNKSAFLCGVMKTYRQREKQGTKVSDSTKGPDEAKIKELLDRTQYTLDVTTGQRKYGGPPPESVYSGAQPTVGTEVQSEAGLKVLTRSFVSLSFSFVF